MIRLGYIKIFLKIYDKTTLYIISYIQIHKYTQTGKKSINVEGLLLKHF